MYKVGDKVIFLGWVEDIEDDVPPTEELIVGRTYIIKGIYPGEYPIKLLTPDWGSVKECEIKPINPQLTFLF